MRKKHSDLYPDIVYTSGIEKTKDGISYECPAIYDDNMVQGDVSNIKKGNAKLAYGNSIYDVKYLVFKSKVLVPYNTFRLIGCETVFDTKRCVAEIKEKRYRYRNFAEHYRNEKKPCGRILGTAGGLCKIFR